VTSLVAADVLNTNRIEELYETVQLVCNCNHAATSREGSDINVCTGNLEIDSGHIRGVLCVEVPCDLGWGNEAQRLRICKGAEQFVLPEIEP
jgi:hypothetical protein